MHVLGIHLGSLTAQAVYRDAQGISRRLTDLEDMRCYPIPSWVALDGSEPLAGHAALRLRISPAPPPLVRFNRQQLRETRPTTAFRPITSSPAPTIDGLLLKKVLSDVPPLFGEKLTIVLTVPDGALQECQARMSELGHVLGLQKLTLLEDSLAAVNHARACKTLNGSTCLSLIFDEDALTITLLRRNETAFAVTAHTVIQSISLLAIRRALLSAIIRDARRWVGTRHGNGAWERSELEAYWYDDGDTFLSHCLTTPHQPFNRQGIFHYGSHYLPLIVSPAVLDSCWDRLHQLLKKNLTDFVERHVEGRIDYALYTGRLGDLLQASDLLQKIVGLKSEAITGQPDMALANGAALHIAQGSRGISYY